MTSDPLLDGLNPEQRAAVTSAANVVQVLAPPGSGKTKTLTARVSYLISRCNYAPSNILVCTFTVKAAREMQARIKSLVGEAQARKLVLGTFHSVARRFLVVHGHLIGLARDFGIADTSDTRAMLKRIIKDKDLSLDPGKALARISSNKARSITAEQYAATAKLTRADEQEFSLVFSAYQAALDLSSLLDYDDLLLRCADLLRQHPGVVSHLQAVLIDEFQDTNSVQFSLMRLFAQQRRTVTIVGDPDQSIYGWRNAESHNLVRMREIYPDTLTIFLEENYRSTAAILGVAQRVIEQDTARPGKVLRATHARGERPVLRRLPTADAEARWLVAELKRGMAMSGGLLGAEDFAVLLRSAALSRHVETALGNTGVPYRMVGGTKFYDRVEVKTLLDYLRVVCRPEHNDALLRVVNVPARGVGDATVKKLLDEAGERGVPLWKLIVDTVQGRGGCRTKLSSQAEKGLREFVNVILGASKKTGAEGQKASPAQLLEYVLKKLDYQKYLQKKHPEDHEARWANVEELQVQTAELSTAIAQQDPDLTGADLPGIDDISDDTTAQEMEDPLQVFLANIALSSATEQKDPSGLPQACVTISTIHAAKGLEWPVVFIPACYEGSIPHSRAEDNDEERRLLYVGMTRAQAMLYLSCPVKNSQSQETTLSSFVTADGVEAGFANVGPELEYARIEALAKVLGRQCPTLEEVERTRADTEAWDDTRWPVDGTFPVDETQRWDYEQGSNLAMLAPLMGRGKLKWGNTMSETIAKNSAPPERKVLFTNAMIDAERASSGFVSASNMTMHQTSGFSTANTTLHGTFASASSRLAELEQMHEEQTLQKIDRRKKSGTEAASELEAKKGAAPAGSKHGANIAAFFGGGGRAPPGGTSVGAKTNRPPFSEAKNVRVLTSSEREDLLIAEAEDIEAAKAASLAPFKAHRPRNEPSGRHQQSNAALREPSAKRDRYSFQSSSPPRDLEGDVVEKRLRTDVENHDPNFGVKPASTFHHTTTAVVQASAAAGSQQRRTLGLRRDFKPWSAKGR